MATTSPVPAPALTWRACSPTEIDAVFRQMLGRRLRCATIEVPRNHHRPTAGNIHVAVMRVAAADRTKRQGALFVNPGGPGADPRTFVALLASRWMNTPAGDPVYAEQRKLGDAFDLIAVVPRGMPGSTPLACAADVPGAHPILLDQSDANLARWALMEQRTAQACLGDPLHPYINTEQTVHDLDLVRRSLGEDVMNFYGVSYGTWLGAWYGATYPERVGRMLFDASMDFTQSMEDNYLMSVRAEHQRFDRLVTTPALAKPYVYRLGTDASIVQRTLLTLLSRVQDAWTSQYRSPESLMAAVAMSYWLRQQPGITEQAMGARIDAETFSPDQPVNDRIRSEARRMLEAVFAPINEGSSSRLSSTSAMLVAVGCNDTPATTDPARWRETLAHYAQAWLAGNSNDLANPCVYWGGAKATKPPIARLATAGRILITASEFDTLTPIEGALNMVNALPNASLLVLRGYERHVAFTLSNHPCVERTAARFLLNGVTPTEQVTECLDDAAPLRVPAAAQR